MSYSVQADLLAQISNEQMLQLTDDAELGSINTDRINEAIAAADAEIDGYLANKYAVPVAAPVPALVKKLSIDFTVYNLWRRRQKVPEDVRKAYEDALAMLGKIAAGEISIGVDPPPTESSKSSGGEVFGPERIFDRDKMGSF